MVGRLVELDLRDGYRTVSDVEDMTTRMMTLVAGLPASVRVVVVADWRQCHVLTPAVAERTVGLMASTNARTERSALLHGSEASTSVLQLMRLIKESELEHRRIFTDPSQLQLWLGEILTEAENERLSTFLLGLGR